MPRKALPLLREFVDKWRPNLIVREAGEYGAVIAAALSNTPHVRVSVSNGHTFANTIEPIDALRREFGLDPDQGVQLRSARAFSAFPASMEPPKGDGAILPQFRVSTVVVAPSSGKPEWATSEIGPASISHSGRSWGRPLRRSEYFAPPLTQLAVRTSLP